MGRFPWVVPARSSAVSEASEDCLSTGAAPKSRRLRLIVIGASDGGIWIHLHVFETCVHEVIVEVLLVELFERRLRWAACVSSISAVESVECHNHVYKHISRKQLLRYSLS